MCSLQLRPWGLRHPARVSVDDVFRCSASGQAGANALVRSLPLLYVVSIFLYHYCYYYSYYYCYYHYYYQYYYYYYYYHYHDYYDYYHYYYSCYYYYRY